MLVEVALFLLLAKKRCLCKIIPSALVWKTLWAYLPSYWLGCCRGYFSCSVCLLFDSVLKIASLFDQETARKEVRCCEFQVAWPHLQVDVPACLTTMWNWLRVLCFSYPLHKWMMDDGPRERFAVFVLSLKAMLLGWMLPYQILTLNTALGDTRVFILVDIWNYCSLKKIFSQDHVAE